MRSKQTTRAHFIGAALLGMGLALAALPGQAAEAGPLRSIPRLAASDSQARVIVRFKDEAALLRSSAQVAGARSGVQLAAALGSRMGLNLANGRALGSHTQVMQAQGMDSQSLARRLATDANVAWAVVDERQFIRAIPNDPLFADGQASTTPSAGQWYLRTPTSAVPASIDATAAWDLSTGSSSVVVAVLDTGIRPEHPDLAGKLLPGYDFVGYGGDASVATANDGDLDDADPTDPGDWITSSENSNRLGEFYNCGASDSSWHGTQVAGLIGAATNNGLGMAGAGRDVRILPVRVLGKCGGYLSDIVAAMRWAAGLSVTGVSANPNPAQVINMSLGGSSTSCSAAYAEAVNEVLAAGVSIVAAAGNEGTAVTAPASCSGVIAVAGVRHVGTKVAYSNLGTAVTISAPAGNCVNLSGTCLYPLLTTTNTGTTTAVSSTYSNGSNYSVGTSFSSPLVAGTVGLMRSVDSSLTPSEVSSLLRSTARSFPTTGGDSGTAACQVPSGSQTQTSECYCTTSTCGAGLLDAGAAVRAAQALNSLTPAIELSATRAVVGDSLSLSGAGSTAPAGRSITSYQWSLVSGADLARFTSATDAATATLLTTGTGSVGIRLTLTDSSGASASTTRTVSVAASQLAAVITVSGTDLQVGDSLSLSATQSVVDDGRSLVAYQWELVNSSGVAQFSGSSTGATAQLGLLAAGSLSVRLTVTDSLGQQASTTQSFTVDLATVTGSGGSGGGATGTLGLVALALAMLALWRRPARAASSSESGSPRV